MKSINFKNYIVYGLCTLFLTGLSSCRHKDLSYEQNRNSRLNVIFDWQKAPDANPAAMAFYLYSSKDGSTPLRFIFQDNTGGNLKVVSGDYHALCLNADLTDWAVFSGDENIESYEISTLDAESLEVTGLTTKALPRAPEADSERIAKTPGMLWGDRQNDISLPASYDTHTIFMYPEEKVCHYIVDVYDSGNVNDYPGGIDASLSGMAEGFNLGKDRGTDQRVTHPFSLKPVISDNSFHSEFLTFGESSGSTTHNISLYLKTAEGKYWNCNVDVTKVVANAPDPKHVHIIIRGLDLPKPSDPSAPMGGIIPDVEDWQTVNITLHM